MKQNYMLEFIKSQWGSEINNLKESKSYSFCINPTDPEAET
jgi:hypothetical protein